MRYFFSLLGLAVIVGAGYFAVAQYVSVAHGQSNLVPVQTADVSATGAQVLALLNQLQGIQLNGAIFSDPNFQSLQDWSVNIAPQTVGRPNPYLSTSATGPVTSTTPRVVLPKKIK